MKFEREERYFVIKYADMVYLDEADMTALGRVAKRIEKIRENNGKRPFKAVVVEEDWPEYEPTFQAIEARVTGKVQAAITAIQGQLA